MSTPGPILPPLTAARRRLLERLRPAGAAPVITRQPAPAAPGPLAFAQERIWFLDQLIAGDRSHNIPVRVPLDGPLDGTALEQALAALLHRHEVLRAYFPVVGGHPVQAIAPTEPLTLPLHDLSTLPPGPAREQALEAAITAHARQQFDLQTGPLFRAALLRLAPTEHLLLLNFHHIIADGWALGVFRRELAAFYAAYVGGAAAPLAALPIRYSDYVAWQRSPAQQPGREPHLAYWREHLAGAPPALDLPGARPASPLPHAAASATLSLPPALSAALQRVGQEARATLYMTLLAAFQVLLYRYTGQADLVIGSPIAGRTRPETEGLLGVFINMLAVRTDLGGNPTFRVLLERVRETTLAAQAHQDLPFEQLVEAIQPARLPNRHPLFQVAFAFQNTHWEPLACGDLRIGFVEDDSGQAQFELLIEWVATAAGLRATCKYDTTVFEAAAINRLLMHYETLLAAAGAAPDTPIAALPLLPPAEQAAILTTWNDTATAYPTDACIHDLIAAQARRTPAACAVTFGDTRLTYADLDARANALAHRLRGAGAGPEVPVGLCVERSPDLVIGLLAILKAGSAYVPLDPAYPPARLAFMLADSAAPLVLTQPHLADRLPAETARPVYFDPAPTNPALADPPGSGGTAGNLAYLIYTSGSTGRPKGTMIAHRQVVNCFAGMDRAVGCTAQDTVLALTSVAFDISVLELLWPLTRGARVALLPESAERETGALLAEATLLQATPSRLRLLLAGNGAAACPTLRALLVGGEALPPDLVAAARVAWPTVPLYNMYGPTETTIWSTSQRIAPSASGSIPIGRPLANTQVYVLDSRMQVVPVGVAGELYIGGAGVARGYLGRPALTAARFVPDPFGTIPGARLYHTGDLACWRADGTLAFLGRVDAQVKIRGYRIEPAEIDAALAQHPAVQQVVVLARTDAPGDPRLVAYLVRIDHTTPAPDSAALRTFLQQSLPEYMLPTAFVWLEALPLTPNGKIDRRALPAPGPAAPAAAPGYLAPRTPLEAVLAEIWAGLLGLERVGVEDNFFALGGHSLLAGQIIGQAQATLRVPFQLRDLFAAPTVAGMADRLIQDPARRTTAEKVAVLLRRLADLSESEAGALLAQVQRPSARPAG